MKHSMEGKTVLITGGSTGIGLGIGIECLKQKAKTLIIVARNQEKLEQAKKELQEYCKGKQEVIIHSCDVGDEDQVDKMIEHLYSSAIENVDYLFINQGLSIPGYILSQKMEDFKYQMNLNYFSHVMLSKKFIPKMMDLEAASGGAFDRHVIFVGSACSIASFVGYGSYSPTKYAIKGYAEALRNELLGTNIRVHLALPVDTDTEGFKKENETKPKECAILSSLSGLQTYIESGSMLVKNLLKSSIQFYVISSFDTYLQIVGATLGVGPCVNRFNYPMIDMFTSSLFIPSVILRSIAYYFDHMQKPKITNFSYKFEILQKFGPILTQQFEMCYSKNLMIARTMLSNASLLFFDMNTKELLQSVPLKLNPELDKFILEERRDGSCYIYAILRDYSVACYDLDEIMKLQKFGNPKWRVESMGTEIDISIKHSILFVIHPFREEVTLLRVEDGSVLARHPCLWGKNESKVFKFCDDENSTLFHTLGNEGVIEGLKFNKDFSQIIEKFKIPYHDWLVSCIVFEEQTGNMIALGNQLTIFDNKLNILHEFSNVGGNHMRFDRKQGHVLICGSPSHIIVYK
ncbi:predicted protein [Naegleria gruberi]|uniref:Predicted protein n=1 Tax=Naegleria gruberi TaxID=5762 RepID=D2UZB5_NAEGR|nr:uncharacterized protein NAEGRDRAFT_61878 [Naegleria gruberi]EFC49918.1 predicted protein [Naegleria gruberi]|eukprot:XP_002682662.1 predicted protein [Naegleria gruberi strain NEG-M]